MSGILMTVGSSSLSYLQPLLPGGEDLQQHVLSSNSHNGQTISLGKWRCCHLETRGVDVTEVERGNRASFLMVTNTSFA